MATTVGVGPFGVLATVPTAAFQSSAGKSSRTTRSLPSLRQLESHVFPAPKSSWRWRSVAHEGESGTDVAEDTGPRQMCLLVTCRGSDVPPDDMHGSGVLCYIISATLIVRADAGCEDGGRTSTVTKAAEKSELDRLIGGISFGQLCDEFECISSPAVERTARQLVKDIMDIREAHRSLSNFGVNVNYKDPLRSFKGRDKYKRANWIKTALENPTVAVREMNMLSTSVLNIKWTIQGKPKLPPASALGGDLVLAVSSTFTMNQISGQVILHEDEWDLSASHPPTQAYFWTTRLAFSAVEARKDVAEFAQGLMKQLDKGGDNNLIYPDPSGDPRKFFQMEENPRKDLYQVGLVIALLYLLVQFLKLTL